MMEAETMGIVLIVASIGFWDVRSMACSVRWPSWNDVSCQSVLLRSQCLDLNLLCLQLLKCDMSSGWNIVWSLGCWNVILAMAGWVVWSLGCWNVVWAVAGWSLGVWDVGA